MNELRQSTWCQFCRHTECKSCGHVSLYQGFKGVSNSLGPQAQTCYKGGAIAESPCEDNVSEVVVVGKSLKSQNHGTISMQL